jgi:hypothetical protein
MARTFSDGAKRPVDVWLVCSSGGHLLQLVSLGEAWTDRSRVWISNDRSDARRSSRVKRRTSCLGRSAAMLALSCAISSSR